MPLTLLCNWHWSQHHRDTGGQQSSRGRKGIQLPSAPNKPLHATTPQHPKRHNPTPPIPSALCCVPRVALEPIRSWH